MHTCILCRAFDSDFIKSVINLRCKPHVCICIMHPATPHIFQTIHNACTCVYCSLEIHRHWQKIIKSQYYYFLNFRWCLFNDCEGVRRAADVRRGHRNTGQVPKESSWPIVSQPLSVRTFIDCSGIALAATTIAFDGRPVCVRPPGAIGFDAIMLRNHVYRSNYTHNS